MRRYYPQKAGVIFMLIFSCLTAYQSFAQCHVIIDQDFNHWNDRRYTIADAKSDFNNKVKPWTASTYRGIEGPGAPASLIEDVPQETRIVNGELRAEYKANDASGRSGGFLFDPYFDGVEEAYLEYKVKFDNNFFWATGGKLPGLGGSTNGINSETTGRGSIPSGCKYNENGWSARLMWRRNRDQTNQPYFILYSYFAEKANGDMRQDGDCGDGKRIYTGLQDNTWYTVRQYIKLNTPGQRNGTVVMWINGEETYRDDQAFIRHAGKSNLKINALIMNTYRGGARTDPVWHSPRDEYAFFDDFKVWTGCANPPGGVNQAPTVQMTSPSEGQQFLVGQTINLAATASDDNGVDKVNFNLEGGYYSQDITTPYTGTWTPTSPGTYYLSARAFDAEGLSDEKGVTITVVDNTPDCEGVPGGPAQPRSSCNDGDPCTINDSYDNNCNCVGELVIPEITTSADNENCDNPGAIYFSFEDAESRTNIEFSLDGGSSYPLNVADDIGQTSFENVPAGTYDLWSRWGNDECPVDLGQVTVEADPEPVVAVAATQPSQESNDGRISFTFEDTPRWKIKFSLDGGATYPLDVEDDVGNASFENVAPGTYDVWTSWGNDDCPVDLGLVTIHELPEISFSRPIDGATFDEGEAVLIDVLATNESFIASIEMNLDGQFIRSEGVAPYNWNQTDQPEDEVLNTLSVGQHTLTAKATSVAGLTYEVLVVITIEALPRDCHGDVNGTAYRDECDQCVGGNTGAIPCEEDCHGDFGGSATIDDCGQCSGGNTGVMVNDCITSITGEKRQDLEIFPNPTYDVVNISESSSWRIMDLRGNQLKEGEGSVVNMSSLTSGVYILMINETPYKVVKK